MPRVLIVDEDDSFRKQLRTLFSDGNSFDALLEGANGVEALDHAKRELLSLVILDNSLPDMCALQLARELNARAPKLPIFLMMADYSVDTEREALSSGVTAVFSKLDDLAMLVANARAVCGLE